MPVELWYKRDWWESFWWPIHKVSTTVILQTVLVNWAYKFNLPKLSIPKFNNFQPFYAFYLPLNTPKSVLIFFKHTYFITRHWSRWGCFLGLPWFAKIPNSWSRDKPLGGRSSMPSNWLQDIPSVVQALQVCARRVSEIPWDSPWFTWRHDAMTPALKLAMAGHIKKNQSKSFNILQMYATPYLYVYGNGCGFVCVPGPTSYV